MFSNRERNRSSIPDDTLRDGFITVLQSQSTGAENHVPQRKGIPKINYFKSQAFQAQNPFSCKSDYFAKPKELPTSAAYAFFTGDYESAWLGATALALLAELEYHRATGDDRFAGPRREWLRAILSLRLPGAGFRAAPHYIGEEHYFNGEAWLALAVYTDTFPQDSATATVLTELDVYFLERYSKDSNGSFYHWGTMAAAARFATTGDQKFPLFIAAQATRFLASLEHDAEGGSRVNCASLEGLATVALVLDSQENPLVPRLREIVDAAATANRKLQIRPGQNRIALLDGAYLWSPHLPAYAGAFLNGPTDPATRIDTTQHCLSAMMILEGRGP